MSIFGFTFAESLTSDLTVIGTKHNEPTINTDLFKVNLDYKHTNCALHNIRPTSLLCILIYGLLSSIIGNFM